jgi:hypothetical protein
MTIERDESLLIDLAQPLVAEFAPAEDGELFAILSEAHFAKPDAFADAAHRAGPLAFGLPEFTVLLTPVMLAAMTEVVRYVVDKAMDKGSEVSAAGIRRLFRRRPAQLAAPEGETPVVLTSGQWAEVHRIVLDVAQRGGVAADQAQLIADAVIGRGSLGDGPR